ncbi:phosphate signaling complex protein PhoU [Bacillus sp. FJAT-45350]|uniref:phosphate signaling complex protein PhoU n=1 Tax=Bacillus sp. FJAT-45350 TaxID=2011014 RepID=UPI000BB79901|nr:phosphate signaling complex protein PhoU [Bacillus sp. FJAT-45350]
MSVRETFELALKDLRLSIIAMGHEVEKVLHQVIDAFEQNNENILNDVIKNDPRINHLELLINERVTLMIAKQQPVATDLRKLIVALKISSDLERVGDLAVDIAKVSKRLQVNSLGEQRERLLEIADVAKNMISSALEAYLHSDVLKAQKIATLDDKVDTMFGEFVRGIFQQGKEVDVAEQITNLAFIARYIERIADYATNLAEWVVYEVNGQHFDLN